MPKRLAALFALLLLAAVMRLCSEFRRPNTSTLPKVRTVTAFVRLDRATLSNAGC